MREFLDYMFSLFKNAVSFIKMFLCIWKFIIIWLLSTLKTYSETADILKNYPECFQSTNSIEGCNKLEDNPVCNISSENLVEIISSWILVETLYLSRQYVLCY